MRSRCARTLRSASAGRAACAARTARSISSVVDSTATCSRGFPVRGSTLQTGAAATAASFPLYCHPSGLLFGILNKVPDDESVGTLFPGVLRGQEGARSNDNCRFRWGTGQVRGADGGIARVFRRAPRHALPRRRPGGRRLPQVQPLHAAAHLGGARLGGDGRDGYALRHRRTGTACGHLLHRRRRGRFRRPAHPGPALRRHHGDDPPRPARRHQCRLSRHPAVAALSAPLHPRRPPHCPPTPPRWARRCSPPTATSRCARCCPRPWPR